MKKLISLFMCFCFLFISTTVANASPVDNSRTVEKENPVIVVRGMDFSTGLQYDRGTENARYVHMEVDAKGIFITLMKAAAAAITMSRKKSPIEVISEYAFQMLEGYSCDANGDSVHKNVTSASYPLAAGNYPEFNLGKGSGEIGLVSSLVDRYGGNKVYYFVYDWRLDPWDNADGLNTMVDRALDENNAEKVDVICCSMGGSITLTYIAKYGYEKIGALISNTSVIGGTDVVNDLFQGKVKFDPLAVENKLKSVLPRSKGFVTILAKIGLLKVLCKALNNFVEKHKKTVFDKALIPTLSTLPGYWSMVNAENYPACREYIFGDKQEEYAGLLARLDRYYENVSSKRNELLKSAAAGGVKIVILANYNTPLICVYENAVYQGDGIVETRPMSLGALVSKVGYELSPEELALGEDKYISADKCINASTCLFPDYTWFGKDAGHVVGEYNSDYTNFIFKLLECEVQPTVDMWEEYPQFMQSDAAERLVPLKG